MSKELTEAKPEKESDSQKKIKEEAEKKNKEEAERKEKLKGQKTSNGDMVMVDILGTTLEEDESHNMIFQASNPEDAKLLPNYDPKNVDRYVNDLAIIGKKGFLEDKIDAIMKDGLEFFTKKEVILEPIDAFGEREGKKIEKVNQKQFMKDMNGEKPYPGAQYKDKKGRSGTVLRANQGRLIVDFNHPLAGKKVKYSITVTDKIEGFENQCQALLSRRLGGVQTLGEMFKIDHDKKSKTLEIEIPQMLTFQLAQQQGGIYFKMGVSMDLQENLPDVDTVKFVEVFKKTPAPVPHDHDHSDHDHHDHEH